MKHQITWYVLPSRLLHRVSRKYCFGWTYQPDSCEFRERFEQCSDPNEWCPLCLMYGKGLTFDNHSLVLSKYTVSHVHSSPILESPWNIQYLCIGMPDSPFLQKFATSAGYREVFLFDVNMAEEQLFELGPPKTEIDQRAKEEAIQVIRFLKDHMVPQHIVISKEALEFYS